MGDGTESSSSILLGTGKGLSCDDDNIPSCYVLPPSQRSNLRSSKAAGNVPVVDLAGLDDPQRRSPVITDIRNACSRLGFFQIVNHGICQSVLDGALSSALEFFESPKEERMKLMSADVDKPVRYSTSLKDGSEKLQFWRTFLKHYAHPLKDWIELWPKNPSNYREKMEDYAVQVRRVALKLMGAITESLGIGAGYLEKKMEEGMQVMAVNCYPECPKPELALGLPAHTDYSCLTILVQSSQGLEIMDSRNDGGWLAVPEVEGALQVQLGDHFEVLSNGFYKSVVHRAALNDQTTRISVASFHSLGMYEKMKPAKQLVDEQRPLGYKPSSFRDFLNFLSLNDIAQGKTFIQTLKINEGDH